MTHTHDTLNQKPKLDVVFIAQMMATKRKAGCDQMANSVLVGEQFNVLLELVGVLESALYNRVHKMDGSVIEWNKRICQTNQALLAAAPIKHLLKEK